MPGNGHRDNLDAAQDIVNKAHGDGLEPEIAAIALQIALNRTLIDIARSLRSLEGYLCNPYGTAALHTRHT